MKSTLNPKDCSVEIESQTKICNSDHLTQSVGKLAKGNLNPVYPMNVSCKTFVANFCFTSFSLKIRKHSDSLPVSCNVSRIHEY